jgi:hypothetical protein
MVHKFSVVLYNPCSISKYQHSRSFLVSLFGLGAYCLTKVELLVQKHQWTHQWWNPHLNLHSHPKISQRTADGSWRLHRIPGFSEKASLSWNYNAQELKQKNGSISISLFYSYVVIFNIDFILHKVPLKKIISDLCILLIKETAWIINMDHKPAQNNEKFSGLRMSWWKSRSWFSSWVFSLRSHTKVA